MDKNLITWLGLYYADGRKTKYLSFVNTDPNLIYYFIQGLRKFGITQNQLKARVQISRMYKDVWKSEISLIKWWYERTGIPTKNFWKTRWVKTKKTYLRKRKPPSVTGELEVVYLNKSFLQNIKQKITEVINTNRKIVAIYFLRGVFAGDGFVKLKNNSKLQEIRIGATCTEEKEKICKLLQLAGIQPGKWQKFDIPIYGKSNFEKIKRLRLFELSHDKLNKFLNGFKALYNGE